MPLSSHAKTIGIGVPWCAAQPAVLNAPCAVEWLADASPKLAKITASGGSGVSRKAIRRAMPMLNVPLTALRRCDAIVLVCGGMLSRFDPSTLCRPPAIGSSAEAVKLSSMSHSGVSPASCFDRSIWNAAER